MSIKLRNMTNAPTPKNSTLPHGGERLNSLAAELAAVDEQCYRAAVEELYMDASGELAEKEAELATLRKDWQPIETAPKFEQVLISYRGVVPEKPLMDVAYCDGKKWIVHGCCEVSPIRVTHWMPLPQPPKGGGHE